MLETYKKTSTNTSATNRLLDRKMFRAQASNQVSEKPDLASYAIDGTQPMLTQEKDQSMDVNSANLKITMNNMENMGSELSKASNASMSVDKPVA